MRVLAADPGYDRLGVAVLEHEDGKESLLYSGCIETDRSQDLPDRIAMLGNTFEKLLTEYKPEAVALETLFFNKNQKTAIGVAQARGALLILAKRNGCTVYEFGPQEVKIAVTGYGNSDKQAVFTMLKRLLPAVPEKALDDEYDAIAVGITCLTHNRK